MDEKSPVTGIKSISLTSGGILSAMIDGACSGRVTARFKGMKGFVL